LMRVAARYMSKTVSLSVQPSDTILALKESILESDLASAYGVNCVERMRIVFSGRNEFQDDRLLVDYNIQEDDTIYVLMVPGKRFHATFKRSWADKESQTAELSSADTLLYAFNKVKELLNISDETQTLYLNGEPLMQPMSTRIEEIVSDFSVPLVFSGPSRLKSARK